MSALTDATTHTHPTGRPCSVANALHQLDPDSAADLQAWLAGQRPDLGSDREMWQRLQALGYRVSEQTLGRHRRGSCRCAQ